VAVDRGVTAAARMLRGMGDVLVVAAVVIFVIAMLGLMRGMERI
jgi:hypothetical protein